ncbi:MAG: fused MFS/spermidine synthase [Actinomycetales bacterium]|nr:fused MFS/spermidine synthase [Actinomycetales bacterium]
MTERPGATLSSGLHAEIRPDRFSDHGLELVVDGTPQSHVDPDDPTHLFYEYVQRMGTAIDLLGLPGQPITALHLGAGALTLPRYVHATRPGSRQQVLELERALVDLVRAAVPLPRGAAIRVRYGDARELLGRLPAALHGACDLVIVDVFGGARVPAHVTSLEFYRELAAFLAPGGLLLVNAADGAGAAFARAQAATLRHVLHDVAVVSEQQVLKGRRFGNFVLLGAHETLPESWLRRMLAGGPHPAALVHGAELAAWIGSAPIVTDATAVPSPSPNRSIFQLSRGAAEALAADRDRARSDDGSPG